MLSPSSLSSWLLSIDLFGFLLSPPPAWRPAAHALLVRQPPPKAKRFFFSLLARNFRGRAPKEASASSSWIKDLPQVTLPAGHGGDDGVPLSWVCRRIKIGAHLGLVSASLLAPRSGRGRAAVANHHNHNHTKWPQGRQPDRRFPPVVFVVVVVVEEFGGAVAGRCFRCRGSRLLGQTRAGLQSAGR